MIDPQTIIVSVTACVVIVAVWAWGIIREDASTARAHASGIALGRALERGAARGAIVAGTRTGDPAAKIDVDTSRVAQDAPNGAEPSNDPSRPESGVLRAIPSFLQNDGSQP